MRICIENGTFTLSFVKEGLLKVCSLIDHSFTCSSLQFRGWVDDLLATSWEACKGSDVLIESPSAMGGYHIAEALGIPYFRAFTMTWSRTRQVQPFYIVRNQALTCLMDRAYPHAFAVPEHKVCLHLTPR